MTLNIFSCVYWSSVLFWEISVQILYPIFSWVVCIFVVELCEFLYFVHSSLLNIWFANNFSHSVGCLFVLIMVSFTVWQLIKQLDVIPFVYFCFHFPCFGTRFTKRCEWHYHLHILLGILWFKLLHSSL